MRQRPKLSIVLPVFNEEKNIPLVAERYALIAREVPLEIIFVEDSGSTDNTRREVRRAENKYPFVRHIFIKKRGYGASIMTGLLTAKGAYVGWTHADLQTDPEDILRAYSLIPSGTNSFFIKGRRYGRPLLDKIINTWGMSLLETFVLGTPLYDINAQPNIFPRKFLEKVSSDAPADFSFDLFFYVTAKRQGLRVIRFPVFFGERLHGKSAWNTGMKARWKFIKRTIAFTITLKRTLRRTIRK